MSNIAIELIKQNKLTRETFLDLGNCGLKIIPFELYDCIWLSTLNFGKLSPRKSPSNKGTSEENRKSNNLDGIGFKNINKLTNLKRLYLDRMEITDIFYICQIKQLRHLSLTANLQIKNYLQLSNLINLTTLEIPSSNLNNITFIKNLKKLKKINLFKTKIQDIEPLRHTTDLNWLRLSDNSMIDNFSVLGELKKLKYLDINKNNISDASFLNKLVNLETLNISHNYIHDISFIENLNNIVSLNLDSNNINDIRPLLNLIKKGLTIVVDKEIRIIEKNEILLSNNPITNPPLEIVKQGRNAIIRYFDRIEQEGKDFIYEAKLTLVGEGSSGKTSLQRRIIDKNAILPTNDSRTRGIKVYDWEFNDNKKKSYTAHIWDFGGQDVYYPVHRFFITENSVFILLASTRQTHHNFDYWLPTIYQFGGNSPIILGQTCFEGNKVPWNDLGVFISNPNFNIIKTNHLSYYEINLLNNNEGLEQTKQTIINQILDLPRFGSGVPKSWVPIREIIYDLSTNTPCISFERFKEICKSYNPESFSTKADITDYCQFLHDIGVVLWYSTKEELKNWVILQPEWAMNAVYLIIDDEIIQKRTGHITAQDFKRLWQGEEYEDYHLILKNMLTTFKIAFPKKHKQEDYIIPVRLHSIPNEKKWEENEAYLRLDFKYEFMPKGIVNQLSAELSKYIILENEVWNNAANFSYENEMAQCQVLEDFYNRKINIRAKGKDARALLILVMEALKDITDSYKGVKTEIYVPCICRKCKEGKKPTLFLYDDLLRWSADDESPIVFCNESRTSIKIDELIYNVGLPNYKKRESIMKTITIFLASSSELKGDREQFEIFINRENKRLNKQSVFLNLELWEDFIDAMSSTRLQDEYNKVVKESDIFISLFSSKVGKYTAEEFEIAFKHFKNFNKPLIYTYFKDTLTPMSQIKPDDILSKFEFEKKLKEYGHFPTIYTNIDDLKYKFKKQLEMVLDSL